jgi:hypothetical protein
MPLRQTREITMFVLRIAASRLAVILALFLLTACGGGGGGGGGGPDLGSAAGLSISPTSIGFSAVQGGTAPASQSIQVTISDPAAYSIIGGHPAGTTPPSWLSMTLTGSGSSWNLNLFITSTSLAPGTYNATVRVLITRIDDTVIAYRDAQVTYTVRNSFATSPGSLAFNYVSGGTLPAAQNVSVTASSPTGWTVSANQGWVSLGTTSGTTPSTVSVSANPAGLSAGTHNAVITFTANGNGATATVNVSLTVSPPVITASPSTLYFMYVRGGTAPGPQSVTVGGTNGLNWTASANQPWVTTDVASGTTPSAVSVSVNPASLPVGIHTAAVTFTAGALTTTLNVSFTVADPVLNVSPASLSISGTAGSTLPQQFLLSLSLSTGAAETWNANAGAPWVVLGQSTGTTPSSLTFNIDTSGLAAGTHTTTITISGAGYWSARTIDVTLNLAAPTLSASPASLAFGGTSGHDLADKTVALSLNTGSNAYNWNISSASSWLQVTPANGSVSATPVNVTVRANAASLPAGATTGTIVFAAQVGGTSVTRTVSVQANLDDHRILASDVGVALTSTPTLSRLTRTLNVHSNRGAVVNWSAASDQAWLAATASGTTTGDLVLTANPTGLAADTVHYATVAITSDEPTVTSTETVRVGLWVGSTTPGATTTIASSFWKVVADPIRPYAYVHSGGTGITVYNVYTGTVVATIPSVAAQLSDMAVARDGSRLFAVDATNFVIVPVDLPAFSIGTGWAIGASVPAYLAYARSNGAGLLLSGNGRIFDATNGSAYAQTFGAGYYGNSVVAASLGGSRFCALVTGLSPYTVTCRPLDHTTTAGGAGQVLLGTAASGSAGSNGKDVALSADGSRAYVASGSPYVFSVYDAATITSGMPVVQSLPANAYPNAIEIGADGRIYGGASVWYGPKDVWIYNGAGVLQSDYYVSGYARSLLDRGIAVSGDGLRMTTLTDDPSLRFTTVGP